MVKEKQGEIKEGTVVKEKQGEIQGGDCGEREARRDTKRGLW